MEEKKGFLAHSSPLPPFSFLLLHYTPWMSAVQEGGKTFQNRLECGPKTGTETKIPHTPLFLKLLKWARAHIPTGLASAFMGLGKAHPSLRSCLCFPSFLLCLPISQSPFGVGWYPRDGSRPMRCKQNTHSFKSHPLNYIHCPKRSLAYVCETRKIGRHRKKTTSLGHLFGLL